MKKNEQERTVGSDRIRITHHESGVKTIAHLVLGGEAGVARRKGKPIFESLATIEVPPAFHDFVSEAFSLEGARRPAPSPSDLAVLADVAEAIAAYRRGGVEAPADVLGTAVRLIVQAAFRPADMRASLVGAAARIIVHLNPTPQR